MRLEIAAAASASLFGSGAGGGRGVGRGSALPSPVQFRAQTIASGNEQLCACRISASKSPPAPASWLNQLPCFGPLISTARLPLLPHRSVLRVLCALLGGPSRASATAAA